ncbi:type II toxin-antitoxin system VapC family toxin [uncultured Thiodictyon sp.]|uniref:type II toxin-antitoxin system tRNA(fMet)-specific endonuclease VapC n=1 Tax=uncultured Thiodictyon sp. TaxID=1846217 RepID=UPI0025CDC726|nr:type II toxin-antitoxin system VapC family toxin [uncultured Thiodictyon sp.]
MRWMLDTNTCIYTMKHHPPQVRARLRRLAIGEVGISAIVLAELQFGIQKSQRRAENAAALADFLPYCLVLDWPHEASGVYAEIRAELEAQGTPIGANDLLIAAHAMHLGCTLVTNNVEEFKRVRGLLRDNWV